MLKPSRPLPIPAALIAALLGLALAQLQPAWAENPTVRLGACPTCTGEGIEGLILRQTNIADLVGIKLNVLWLNPPQQGEGVASKSLDVEWVGDQPTLAQLANEIPVKIIGYQYDFQLRVEAMPPAKLASDLKDKKIGVPFGTTAYQLAADTLTSAGIPLNSLVNVAPTDLGTALTGGQVAAIAIWDPLWGIIEKGQHTTPIARANHSAYTLVSKPFLESNRDAVVKFLEAQILAMAFRATHHSEADTRYQAAFGIATDIVEEAQKIDRSYDWKSPEQVSLELTARDYQNLENTMTYTVKAGLIPRQVDIKGATDMALWKEALQRIKAVKITVSQIKYVTNAK